MDSGLAMHNVQMSKTLTIGPRGGLNLGKKISVPKDVMMEELNLQSNRGSRMFQERQKRAEKYIVENAANVVYKNNAHPEAIPPPQIILEPHGGKENQVSSIPCKHSLVMNLQKTVAKKGSPAFIAPGYSGPLKVIPHEKFNATVIPKLYCSPWMTALGNNEEFINSLGIQLPELPQRLQPANYRSFNRSPKPFGGAMASKRAIPVIGYEAVEVQALPEKNMDHMAWRPNFNRAPKGWGSNYCPESNEM
ncbi:myozenin-2 [Genypterus blacodes]|uniref:myozenin-2 n=1 Tax=Genypterus blacodes TaxID=154954 RepID=UPI003F75D3F9